jgi:hypothetical protein
MILMIANYSRELADYIIYVIDVSGGDKIPRKGGPGISQSDLLIVNKVRCSSNPIDSEHLSPCLCSSHLTTLIPSANCRSTSHHT